MKEARSRLRDHYDLHMLRLSVFSAQRADRHRQARLAALTMNRAQRRQAKRVA